MCDTFTVYSLLQFSTVRDFVSYRDVWSATPIGECYTLLPPIVRGSTLILSKWNATPHSQNATPCYPSFWGVAWGVACYPPGILATPHLGGSTKCYPPE